MIDIHTHILPNVDDGASSLAESLQMLERMERDGTTYVVATPHYNAGTQLSRAEIVERVVALNAALDGTKLKIQVLPGAEIALLDPDAFREAYEAGTLCHLGDKAAYTLLEFPWRSEDVPTGALELIGWLVARGTTPVIAHPERTPYLRENPRVLQELVQRGAILQVTVDSVCGLTSGQSKMMAESILRAFEPVVLASDSHNLARCSGLSTGLKAVARKFGMPRAALIQNYSNAMLQNILNA